MLRKQPVFSWGNISLGKHHLLMLALPLLLFATHAQAKFCTSLKAIKKDVDGSGRVLCTESYQAKCGWFTFKMCTFYEKVPCAKGRNGTKVTYKIVTECCRGYKMDDNNLTCIRNDTAYVTMVTGDTGVTYKTVSDENNVTQDEDHMKKVDVNAVRSTQDVDDDDDSGLSISHGAFAAIASAGLFIICVTIVIIIHVRKKQIREERKKKEAGTAMETRKMIHIVEHPEA